MPCNQRERVVARHERLLAAVYGDEQAAHEILMEAARAARDWGNGQSYELVMRPTAAALPGTEA